MGFGNSKEAIQNNFIPMVRNYINNGSVSTPTTNNTSNNTTESFVVRVTSDTLNIRKGPGVSYGVSGELGKGEAYTIVETQNGWGKLKSGAGWINLNYTERTSNASTAASSTVSTGSFVVKVTTHSLNVRKGPSVSDDVTCTVKQGEVYTIVETQNGWGKLKSGAGWISLGYTEKLK